MHAATQAQENGDRFITRSFWVHSSAGVPTAKKKCTGALKPASKTYITTINTRYNYPYNCMGP